MKRLGLVIAILLAAIAFGTPAAGDEPNLHGMLMVGEETVYLSHLPLFGAVHAHDYQVILEATVTSPGSTPRETYVKDRQETGTRIYTLDPKAFVLPNLVAVPSRLSFQGTIFRGHFERSGEPLIPDVLVNVTRVVHFRKLDAAAQRPSQLEYILFGKGQELFLAHAITAPPDFDQILSVKISGPRTIGSELRAGMRVVFPSRADTVSERLKEGEQVAATVQGAEEDPSVAIEVQVEPVREFYCEQGELSESEKQKSCL